MTKKELICTKCGGVLEVDECDYTSWGSDTVIGCVSGICPECGKGYTWKKVYKLSDIIDLKEDKE